MTSIEKKIFLTIIISVVTAILLSALISHIPLRNTADVWLYGQLVKERYRLAKPPAVINDVVLVLMDNETINKMPSSWPYPRSDFAAAIDNLERAGAKVIGFDFTFMGKAAPEEDASLKSALERYDNIVLACSVNKLGFLDFYSSPVSDIAKQTPSGIITKLQDGNGITRRALTYLVSDKDPASGFLSWEMRILNAAGPIDMASFSGESDTVTFRSVSGLAWDIPVSAGVKSFMINFSSHTADFRRLSFYNVFKGDFEPSLVKNKIVLVGLASSLFEDIHNTPIGWMPGITINANAFLTLYGRSFLKDLPKIFEFLVMILGVIIGAFLVSIFGIKRGYILIVTESAIFFLSSFLLLACGYVWNYFDAPFMAIVCPYIAKKMADLTYGRIYA